MKPDNMDLTPIFIEIMKNIAQDIITKGATYTIKKLIREYPKYKGVFTHYSIDKGISDNAILAPLSVYQGLLNILSQEDLYDKFVIDDFDIGLVILKPEAKEFLHIAKYIRIDFSDIIYVHKLVYECICHPEYGIMKIIDIASRIEWNNLNVDKMRKWLTEIIDERNRLLNKYEEVSKNITKVMSFNFRLKDYSTVMKELIRELSYLIRDAIILLDKIFREENIKAKLLEDENIYKNIIYIVSLLSDASFEASKLISKWNVDAGLLHSWLGEMFAHFSR